MSTRATNCPDCNAPLLLEYGVRLTRREPEVPKPDPLRRFPWHFADGQWNPAVIRPIATWLRRSAPGGRQSASALYAAYADWIGDQAATSLPSTIGFSQALVHLGVPRRRTATGIFYEVEAGTLHDDDEQVSTAGGDDGRSGPEEGERAAAGQQDH